MLLVGILVLGTLVAWVGQLILGLGVRPNAQALIAGVAGAFVGGLVATLITGDGMKFFPSGMIGAFAGAVVVLAIWRAIDRRSPKT